MPTTIRKVPYEVRQRLADLGLTREILLEVVQATSNAHANCTENDPPAARWDKDDTDTYSVILNHKERVRVVVVNSTVGTGLELGAPLNVAKKGPRSAESALENRQMVLDLAGFQEERARRIRLAEAAKYATWCLCVFVDGDTVRAELSQPVGFSRGYVTRWEERILLIGDGIPPMEIRVAPPNEDDGLSPEFPINIQRK
jgi:hypothetical protein